MVEASRFPIAATHSCGSVALDSERLEQLNDYFGSLCTDDSYIEPLPVTIDDSVQVPEISELQVWQSLCKLKRTAVGPDNIPFWIWKDLADSFTPVDTKVWNLCLLTLASHAVVFRGVVLPSSPLWGGG